MTRTATPTCSEPRCTRKTKDPSGRCHDHRAGARVVGAVTPPAPRLSSSTPDRLEHYPTGELCREMWVDSKGRAHREDGPALIIYGTDGRMHNENYYFHGKPHREDGPAEIDYYPDGGRRERYYRHGVRTRDDGPAEVFFYPDGEVEAVGYVVDGKNHRGDGPAQIDYDREGNVLDERYSLFGTGVSKADVEKFAEAISSGAPEEWARAYVFGNTP